MNDRDKSTGAISHFDSYAFPNFHETAKINGADNSVSGQTFQPMFHRDSPKADSSIAGPQAKHKETKEDPLEKARHTGYQRGVDAGKEKACLMVQANLSPIIVELTDALEQFDDYYRGVCESSATLSLKLALDIVEKITGVPSVMQLEDLAEVGTHIHEAIANAYGIHLKVNPQDFIFITELSACENTLIWENYPSVAVSPDDTIASGEIKCADTVLQEDSVNQQIAVLVDKIMALQNSPTE